MEADVLTVEEAAKRLRISRGSAYEAARRGQLPTIRIGRRLLVPKAAFERMLAGTDDFLESKRQIDSDSPKTT